MFSLFGLWFGPPGPVELLIVALIIVILIGPVAVAVLLIVQHESRQRKLRGSQPRFSRPDHVARDGEPVDVEVREESDNTQQPAERQA